MRRSLPILAGWSAAAVVGAATLLASVNHFVNPGLVPIDYVSLQIWMVAVWTLWVLIAPTVVWLSGRTRSLEGRQRLVALVHLLTVVVLLVVHGIWSIGITVWLSPYTMHGTVEGAMRFFFMYIGPVDVAMYAAVAAWASRVVLQDALAESERKFRSIFENAVIGIFRMTPDGRYLMANAARALSLGYPSPDELIADPPAHAAYADPDDLAAYLDAIRHDGQVVNWTARLRRRDGTLRWMVESSRGVFDALGRLQYIEGTAKDMTDEMAARDALYQSERRTVELRAELADAQLRALRLQLKPHFLFNILNTVTMMIRNGDTANAEEVVALLGDMFRRLLEFEGQDTVALEVELASLDLYIRLQQFRYEGRMEVVRDVDAGVLGAQVPTLILQPIVENAIKHGVARVTGSCRLELSARRRGAELVIEVVNETAGTPAPADDAGYGIGTRNTRERLAQLYGDRASFELQPGDGQMRAVLVIPMEDDR